MLCSWTIKCYGQSDDFYKGVIKTSTVFKLVGSFIAGDFVAGYKTETINGESKKALYKYSFNTS